MAELTAVAARDATSRISNPVDGRPQHVKVKPSLGNSTKQGVGPASVSDAARAVGQEAGSATLNRAKMVDGSALNNPQEFTHWWGPTKDRVTEQRGMNVEIDQPDVQSVNKFLDKLVNDWAAKAKEPAPPTSPASNMLEYLLQNPFNQEMRYVMELLSKTDVGANGESLISADPTKIKEFLKSEDNWAVSLMLMEEKGLMDVLALSATVKLRQQFYNRYQREDVAGKAIWDQQRTLPSWIKSAISGATGGIEAGIYWLVGTGNAKPKFDDDNAIYQAVKNAPRERKEYMKAMTGVDVDKLTGVNAQSIDGYSVLVQDLKTEIGDLYETRGRIIDQIVGNESYTTVGRRRIDRGRKIRTPEDDLFDGRKDSEQNAMRYYRRIIEIYTNDTASQSGNREAQLFARSRARKKLLVEYLRNQIIAERAKSADAKEASVIPVLKAKEAKLDSDPAGFIKDEREKHDKAKKEADEKVTKATERKTALTTGEGAIATKAQAVLTQEAALIREFNLDPDKDIVSAMRAELEKLEGNASTGLTGEIPEAEERVEDLRDAKLDEIDKVREAVSDKIADITKDFATQISSSTNMIGTVTPPAIDPKGLSETQMAEIAKEFDAKIAVANSAYEKLVAKREKLEEGLAAYNNAVRELDSATRELARQEQGQIDKSGGYLAEFTATSPPATTPGPYPGQPEKVRDLPVADLVKALASATPPIGATDAERLEMSLSAKAAEEATRKAALSPEQEAAITELLAAGISSDATLIKTRKELTLMMEAHFGKPGTFGAAYTAEEIRNFIDQAYTGQATYLRALAEARADKDIAYYEEVSKAEQKAIEHPDSIKTKKADVGAAIGVVTEARSKGPEGLYARLAALTNDTARKQSLADQSSIAGDDARYTEAEKASGLTAGEIQWYREFFPGYVRAENRDDLFKALLRAIPQATLHKYLMAAFNIGGTVDFANIAGTFGPATYPPPVYIRLAKTIATHMADFGLAV